MPLRSIIFLHSHFNPRSPHGERQYRRFGRLWSANNFNPRSPHGERPTQLFPFISYASTFQPTLPARGATLDNADAVSYELFQPTLPARGATR